jgi:hypothetical protein
LRIALILAVIIFVITLAVRLPASMLLSHLPSEIVCEEPSGTVWSGSCAQVHSNGINLADVSWSVHPLALLTATVRADLSSADPNAGGSGSVELARNGDASITGLHFILPLLPAMQILPAGSSATLVLDLPSAKIHGEHLVALEGTIDLRQLHLSNPSADLGSYQLQFQPPGEDTVMLGQLHDLEGPLAVSGQLQLQPSGAYEINGTVLARNGASADLNQALQTFLGPADSQGQRAFSLAGTF